MIGKWEWEREMDEESEAMPVLTIERIEMAHSLPQSNMANQKTIRGKR